MSELLKVFFNLEQDEDGYPGVSVESVWAIPTADNSVVKLDNVPFFTYEATIDDLIRVHEEDGKLWFQEVLTESINSMFRILFFDIDVKDKVRDHLVGMGCVTELFASRKLLAVSVPGPALLFPVREYLKSERDAGSIDVEEAIVRE